MAITIDEYDYFRATITGGTAAGGTPVDYLTDTINAALVVAAYTPALTTHDFWDDVSANELANGDGYTTNGLALSSKTTSAPAAGVVTYDAADLTWTFTASKTFRYMVVMKWTGSGATSPLMFLVDFGASQVTSVPTTVTLAGTGLFTIS